MREKEIIRLDARVRDVIADAVFRAELRNGHQIVAYGPRDMKDRIGMLQPGDSVTVEMSPFDMSRGRIVEWKTSEVRNEGS
jgi:translation initiation factor IF-1